VVKADPRHLARSPESAGPTVPAPLPLDPADVPVVYAEILRSVYERSGLADVKSALRAELGCSRSALDGVHAQLTKDLATAYAACPDAHQWGGPADVMRLAARTIRAHASDDGWEPLPGVREFAEAFGVVCHRRGSGILWEQMLGGVYSWGTVVGADEVRPYRGAAHTDFDFPAKIEWRKAWEAFLKEHLANLSADAISRLRVICLPSKDPRRELSLYLKLGIRPENIVAVEGNAEAAQELRRNCRILGGGYERVQIVSSDLLRYVKSPHEPFDVISLDYHGCAGFDKAEITRHLRTAPWHYVLVNLEAAREKPLGQQLLREKHDQSENYLDNMALRVARTAGEISSASMKQALDERGVTALSDARDDGPDVVSFGHGHWTERSTLSNQLRRFEDMFLKHGTVLNRKFPHIVTPQAELDSLVLEATAYLGRVMHGIATIGNASTGNSGRIIPAAELAHLLYLQYQEVVYRPADVHDLRRYEYRSSASNTGQTYLSTFAALMPGIQVHSSMRAVAEFFVEYGIHMYENFLAHPDWAEFCNRGIMPHVKPTRNGNVLFQAYRNQENGPRVFEGPVLSSASIVQGIDEIIFRDTPHMKRMEELYARPRQLVTG